MRYKNRLDDMPNVALFSPNEYINGDDFSGTTFEIIRCGVVFVVFIILFSLSYYLYGQHNNKSNSRQMINSQSPVPISNTTSYIHRFIDLPKNSLYFTPLFQKNPFPLPPVSLDRISFMISSSPASAKLCDRYLKMWNSEFGSNIIKNTGMKPHHTVYWRTEDESENLPKDYQIDRINESNYHFKWAYMIIENFKNVPNNVDWFVAMDDDTLPFLDRLLPALSKYPNPRDEIYYIHSPGERKSGTHTGNGGSGHIMSRKWAETVIPSLKECNSHIMKRIKNGDIRLDLCSRRILDQLPTYDYGLFHMDPKGFKGDLTGFVEGFLDRMNFKVIHHMEKYIYYLFPKSFGRLMMNNDINYTHTKHFVKSARISGDLFLKRFAMRGQDDTYYILNMGYSFITIPRTNKTAIDVYLNNVESTFTFTESLLYDELNTLLVPPNQEIKRFYLKNVIEDSLHPFAYWQEFSPIDSLNVAVRIYVDSYQRVSLNFLNATLVHGQEST
ncbi:hypothetical protein TRFO_38568 [Tritrichomonas foetus]|uniref:Fringe-like glycosyltransferase domain-containing protein n=1 Tax=Tritrichomonas foetus TaxID=1144522 RepID=A0A1J4JD45_9EUKA|nr:hypothetical protein TRFO_38568 [Tritrichomonas foetus]|eukprot:OHS95333.1 hypothetical protein TRFO_38568 [Tritrichomonas foetus]